MTGAGGAAVSATVFPSFHDGDFDSRFIVTVIEDVRAEVLEELLELVFVGFDPRQGPSDDFRVGFLNLDLEEVHRLQEDLGARR